MTHCKSRIVRSLRALPVLAALALTVSLTMPQSAAHERRGPAHVRHPVHAHVRVHPRPPAAWRPAPPVRRVVAPARITVATAPAYRPYLQGRVWEPLHGHYHAVYRFPTQVGGVWTPVSRTYCEGRYWIAPRVDDRPRFGIYLSF